MIDLTIHKEGRARAVKKAKERGFVVPTLRQMYDPSAVPEEILGKLAKTGLWEVDPVNMFRISWHNEPMQSGGLFGPVNYVELPTALTGVSARIVCLVGKWFPTGCHKVGASFGCLAPRLVTGQFDPTYHKAVWPSTGNYCRGGAFNSKLLACDSIAILPQGMSKERFDWLRGVATEIIATPGSESNVKEIFDKTNELRRRPDCMIFNQFEEMGNVLWHYNVTGRAIAEVYEIIKTPTSRMAGVCFTSGSAGTLSAGDYIKDVYPRAKLAVGEALQCPTILENGFGAHRIEGIGDKHIPWIHNVKNTDMAIAIDDADPMALLRLFNEPAGKDYLTRELGLAPELVESLSLFGISGIANMLCAIKMAKYYELTGDDIIGTVLTDSADMYLSRVEELAEEEGAYTGVTAAVDYAAHLAGIKTDNLEELTYAARRRVHNLKYYTWIEQQGRSVEELDAQWYDPDYWSGVHHQADELDRLIEEFNEDAKG
ncbi:hypothetical protein SDC9_82020 [bioreactor metagenome]|uniref:Cysteine synthase n=1 Tax=bioreactor metagenome TaxID=1076179 RepID=A0A644Z577_9ZZZZ